MNWSKPYCGISHCGELEDARRATVEIRDGFTVLTKWKRRPDNIQAGTEGYGFLSESETFTGGDHEKRAKQAGENHIKGTL